MFKSTKQKIIHGLPFMDVDFPTTPAVVETGAKSFIPPANRKLKSKKPVMKNIFTFEFMSFKVTSLRKADPQWFADLRRDCS